MKNKWGFIKDGCTFYEYRVEASFEPIIPKTVYGIYDKKNNVFVKCNGSKKFYWVKEGHAKSAFRNATYGALEKRLTDIGAPVYTGISISEQDRYEVRPFS